MVEINIWLLELTYAITLTSVAGFLHFAAWNCPLQKVVGVRGLVVLSASSVSHGWQELQNGNEEKTEFEEPDCNLSQNHNTFGTVSPSAAVELFGLFQGFCVRRCHKHVPRLKHWLWIVLVNIERILKNGNSICNYGCWPCLHLDGSATSNTSRSWYCCW